MLTNKIRLLASWYPLPSQQRRFLVRLEAASLTAHEHELLERRTVCQLFKDCLSRFVNRLDFPRLSV